VFLWAFFYCTNNNKEKEAAFCFCFCFCFRFCYSFQFVKRVIVFKYKATFNLIDVAPKVKIGGLK